MVANFVTDETCALSGCFNNEYKIIQMREKEFLPLVRDRLGIESLNEMQLQAMEKGTSGGNLMILAPTGSGKTLAFVLPMLKNLKPSTGRIQAVVMTPTRELTLQAADIIRKIAAGYKVTALYGSHKMEDEINSLKDTPDIIVATPGRLLDHIRRRTADFRPVRILVLDEFDKILELGFEQDMKKVVTNLVNVSRLFLTSATTLDSLPDYLKAGTPDVINYLDDNSDLRQRLRIHKVSSDEKDKIKTLVSLLGDVVPTGQEKTVIFVNYRESAERVCQGLEREGVSVGIYHGALQQHDRENAVEMFANGSTPVLVATDLAARGLDFPEVKNIIHYHQPSTAEAFTHRNGRTARIDREGDIFVIIGPEEDVKPWVDFDDEYFLTGNAVSIPQADFQTLSISAGKKEKLSKGDIVGFLIKKGGLSPDEIGKVFSSDHYSLAAIPRVSAKEVIAKIFTEKIKGEKRKVHLMR